MTFEKPSNCNISQHISIHVNINITVFPRDNHHIVINVKTIPLCSFMKFYIAEAITLYLVALFWEHFMMTKHA